MLLRRVVGTNNNDSDKTGHEQFTKCCTVVSTLRFTHLYEGSLKRQSDQKFIRTEVIGFPTQDNLKQQKVQPIRLNLILFRLSQGSGKVEYEIYLNCELINKTFHYYYKLDYTGLVNSGLPFFRLVNYCHETFG